MILSFLKKVFQKRTKGVLINFKDNLKPSVEERVYYYDNPGYPISNVIGNFMDCNPDLLAKIKYISSEPGWEIDKIMLKHIDSIEFDGQDGDTSAEQAMIAEDPVLANQTLSTFIKLLSPELFRSRLYEGQRFHIKRENQIIAVGEISEILNKGLEDIHSNVRKLHIFNSQIE